MNLSDADFEFIFQMYDNGMAYLTVDKDKNTYAEETIVALVDHGFDVKEALQELSDHCPSLSRAIDEYLELEEEDEDIFAEHEEDDEEMEW